MFRLLLFVRVLLLRVALAAFTRPTSYGVNTVERSKNTWCYFPAAGETTSTSCGGNFHQILYVHLNTTVSIGYYGPDNTRYGGAEWSVPVDIAGKVTLCVSGRAQDQTYQTACMFVTADNSLPLSGGCWVDVAQTSVSDGCYVPEQLRQTNGKSGLSLSDTLAIVFGVISSLGVIVGIWWIWHRWSKGDD